MRTGLDLQVFASLPDRGLTFERGADLFVDLLRRLRRLSDFDTEWMAQHEEGGPVHDLWSDPDAFVESFRAGNARRPEHQSIAAFENRSPRRYDASMNWSQDDPAYVTLEIRGSENAEAIDAEYMAAIVEIVVGWRRPMHLRAGPALYFMDHHVLDRARQSIQWVGWVPFEIAPADVPEAEIVRPMLGGTLVATQRGLWQVNPDNHYHSEAAIARAQDVDVRLNLLGVLPTADDLRAGTWGR